MKLPRFSTKLTVIGAVLGVSLGTGGIAAAYFSTTGTGKGSTTVGSINTTGTFTVSAGTAAFHYKNTTGSPPSALLPSTPGTTNESYAGYTWTVTNKTEAMTHLASVTIAVAKTASSGTAEYTATGVLTVITGCKASWFAIGTGATAPAASNSDTTTITVSLTGITIGPHSNATTNHHSGTYTVQLVNSTSATQTSCNSHTPELKVTATSS